MNIKKIILVNIVILLTACGNNNIPTDANKLFSTSKFLSIDIGIIYTTPLTGSDSNNRNYSGSLSIANAAKIESGGVLVTRQSSLININDDVGTNVTLTANNYIGGDGSLISNTVTETSVTCAAESLSAIPAFVKIGDFATLSTLICNNDTTIVRSWMVEDAFNGNIRIVTSSTNRNSSNVIISISHQKFTLQGNGDIISFSAETIRTNPMFTLTLRSI